MVPPRHAVHSLDTRSQRFVHANPEGGGITCFAVCPARKVLAVGEAAERATLSVYDLTTCKRRKLLVTAETTSKVVCRL